MTEKWKLEDDVNITAGDYDFNRRGTIFFVFFGRIPRCIPIRSDDGIE